MCALHCAHCVRVGHTQSASVAILSFRQYYAFNLTDCACAYRSGVLGGIAMNPETKDFAVGMDSAMCVVMLALYVLLHVWGLLRTIYLPAASKRGAGVRQDGPTI
jgi:hypothetical protein